MRKLLGFVFVLAACGGKTAAPTTPPPPDPPVTMTPPVATPTPPPAGSSDCGTAVDSAIDQMLAASKADLDSMPEPQRAQAKDMLKTMIPKLKASTADACTTDKWSPEVVACVGRVKTEEDFGKCAELLTPDQKTHAQAAMAKAMGDAGMGAPPPSAP